MPRYTVTDPTTNKSVDLEGDSPPTEQELEKIFSTVHGQPPQESSFMSKVGGVAKQYSDSQFGSPSQLLQTVQPLLSKGFGKLGQFATEQLSQGSNKVDPYTAAGVGTAISMAPDLASLAAPEPELEQQPLFRSAARPMAQRALGATKMFRKTASARRQVMQAADIALDQNIIPFSGNPEEMLKRAESLSSQSGQAIGGLRESAGPQPLDRVFNRLESLRNDLTQGGAKGGDFDLVHKKIDDAKAMLSGLYDTSANEPLFKSPPIQATEARQQLALPAPKEPNSTFGPIQVKPIDDVDPALYMREYSVGRKPSSSDMKRFKSMGWDQIETTDGRTVFGDPNYLASLEADFQKVGDPVNRARPQMNADFKNGNAEYYGVEPKEPELPPEPERIDRVGLRPVEAIKKRLSGKVNYMSDLTTQKDTKAISGAIENGVEDILRDSGVDMSEYARQKKLFGASENMKRYLNNELSKSGNEAASLPGMLGAGAELAATGSPTKALTSLGVMEGLRRRGAGVGAKAVDYLGTQVGARPNTAAVFGSGQILGNIPRPEPLFKSGQTVGKESQPAETRANKSQPQISNFNNGGNENGNQNNSESNFKGMAEHPGIISKGIQLTKEKAREFLDKANGVKELARELARKAGYTW